MLQDRLGERLGSSPNPRFTDESRTKCSYIFSLRNLESALTDSLLLRQTMKREYRLHFTPVRSGNKLMSHARQSRQTSRPRRRGCTTK
jgi:hypothetical protein